MDDQNKKSVLIRKASGEEEAFDRNKIMQSLLNAGAENKLALDITAAIESWIYNGVSTKKIYAKAFLLLRRKNYMHALHYRLKQALFDMGPTGYPFETLIGELYRRKGYDADVGITLQGRRVTHEMDVVASQGTEKLFVECKYSVNQGKLVQVQVPLYVHARIEDIVAELIRKSDQTKKTYTEVVATNTRFSSDAKEYAAGVDMQLIAWDYPSGEGLKELMETHHLYPITILNNLNKQEKQQLLSRGVVVCEQLIQHTELLDTLQLKAPKRKSLLNELKEIRLSSHETVV